MAVAEECHPKLAKLFEDWQIELSAHVIQRVGEADDIQQLR